MGRRVADAEHATLEAVDNRLQALCARAGVEASGVLQIRCLKRNRVIAVTTAAIVEAATGRPVAVIKTAVGSDPAALSALAREAACLQTLCDSGVGAPRLLALADAGSVLLRSWATGAPRRKNLSLANVSALGRLLAKIHRIRPPSASGILSRTRLDDRLARCEANLATLSTADRGRLQHHGRQLRRLQAPEGSVGLIHGDIGLDNIVAAADGSVSLIDWAEGSFGAVKLDLAAAINVAAGDSRRLAAFLRGYDAALAGLPGLSWFVAFDSWTRCINCASNGQGYLQILSRLEDQLASAASLQGARSPKARNPESPT